MAGRLEKSYADLERNLNERTRELREAREQQTIVSELLQVRTRELQQALEYQTATSNVLEVIGRSPSNLQPVFDIIVQTALRLCEAERAVFFQLKDGKYHFVARAGPRFEEYDLLVETAVIVPDRGSVTGRTALEGRVIHVHDLQTDPEITLLRGWETGSRRTQLGVPSFRRTQLGVPLLRNGSVLGVISLGRSIVKPFTTTQIELLRTFADQAVIAIENARLFHEVEERGRQLEIAAQNDARYLEWLRRLAKFLRHEVRQPVAQINSSIELIQISVGASGPLKTYVDNAISGVKRVWNLIDRASRATDAEAFVRQGQNSVIELNSSLAKHLSSFSQTYSGVRFEILLPEDLIYVSADPTLIEEAIDNMLVNAVSYAFEETVVRLELRLEGTYAAIEISNKGPLIDEDSELLFSPFVSSRVSLSSEHQGLGLYLVRLIAEYFGGTAIIANQKDGSGVKASFLLPVAVQT